jgi:hypothetical protein
MTVDRNRTVLAILACACAFVVAPTSSPIAAEECATSSYGEGVTLDDSILAAEILARPDDWAGRTVRVEGEVAAVCQMAGCWMDIVAGEGDDLLRVKVEDGVIVFPTAAKGQRAVAQGEVEILEMSAEKWKSWKRHMAEEQGLEFDPADLGEGPYRLVQLRGTGAEICM